MERYSFDVNHLDFKGEANGPSMVITAAIHGNEQTGTYTAQLVAEQLKNEKLLGNVRIIPVCNESAFKARQRPATQDNEDLNRVFPGSENGTYSHQLARHIWNLTDGFDYLVDLHCCGMFGSAYTMCWYSRYDFHKTLSRYMGIKTVIHTAGTGGQLYLEACEKRGQKGLLIELPGGQPGAMIDIRCALDTCEKIINYMKLVYVLDGSGAEPANVRLCGVIARDALVAREDGVYQRVAESGQYIRAGGVIGTVNGIDYVSPFDAVVTSAGADRYVFAGENLASLAPSDELPDGAIQPEQ